VASGDGRIVASERFHPEHVVGRRMVGPEAQRRFRFSNDIRFATLLLRLGSTREMLLDRHCHLPKRLSFPRAVKPRLAGGCRFAHKLVRCTQALQP